MPSLIIKHSSAYLAIYNGDISLNKHYAAKLKLIGSIKKNAPDQVHFYQPRQKHQRYQLAIIFGS